MRIAITSDAKALRSMRFYLDVPRRSVSQETGITEKRLEQIELMGQSVTQSEMQILISYMFEKVQ